MFIARTDAEAETPILWPPHEKSKEIHRMVLQGKKNSFSHGFINQEIQVYTLDNKE